MNSIIVVKTQSNAEIKAKQMIQWFQQQKGNDQIKDVHALETFTEVIDGDTDHITSRLSQADIDQSEFKQNISSGITNLQKQLDVTYDRQKRADIRSEINEQKQRKEQMRTKRIESVIKGYVLVELKEGIEELDNETHALIKNTPAVQFVLSQLPVLQNELDYFFEVIEDELEPQVAFEVEVEPKTMIQKVKELAQKKSNHVKDRFYTAYQKGKRQFVQMPLQTFQMMCSAMNGGNQSLWDILNIFTKKYIQKESINYGEQGV